MADYMEEYLSDPDGSKLDTQLNRYRSEKKAIEEQLAADKAAFAMQLKNGLGKSIAEELNKPKRKNFFTGLKYKIMRLLTIRKERKRLSTI